MTDWRRAPWRKSSNSEAGSCVEVARMGDWVGVRDTKASGRGPVLEFTLPEWSAFLKGVAHGEFDLDVIDRV